MSLGVLFGSGDSGWSAAGRLLEKHSVQVTLVTFRGRVVFVHESSDTLKLVQMRLGTVLERIEACHQQATADPLRGLTLQRLTQRHRDRPRSPNSRA